MDAPARALRSEAELDRAFIAAAMNQCPRALRVEAVSKAIEHLRSGGAATSASFRVRGQSGSTLPGVDKDELAGMNKDQLRSLASQLPGIVRDKKTDKGKWVPKTCKELKKQLLAFASSAHALPGSVITAIRKRPSASTTIIKRPSASTTIIKRPSAR